MTIARNAMTVKFGRERRFLIDDPESALMLAYQLTKPFKLGGTFNNQGVFKFVLQEVNTTDDDNQELCIADYYKYFPITDSTEDGNDTVNETDDTTETPEQNTGKKVWL